MMIREESRVNLEITPKKPAIPHKKRKLLFCPAIRLI
jgi:hypothetical protein